MITSGDIINYDSELLLSQEYMLKNTSLDYDYMRVAKSRAGKTGGTWRHEKLLNRCYFYYTNLPANMRNQLPTRQNLQTIAITYSNDIQTLISNALNDGFKTLLSTYAKNIELAKSAAIVVEASRYCTQQNISFSKSEFFEKLAKEIDLQGLKYLPKSWRNLRDKVREYTHGEPINTLIRAKNEGNINRAQFKNNDLIKGWLIELADTQRNYSSAFMYRKLRLLCTQNNIAEHPSPRWVSDYISQPETQFLINQRYGAGSRFNQRHRAYTPLQSAIYAGDCWQVDGTRVNIIDHRGKWRDKTGKMVTGQKFLYIVVVRDVMSGLPVGWEYCYEENAQVVINALASAVRNTGYLPYELCYDRFPGHNTVDWAFVEAEMQRAKVIMTVSHKAEGKANIERWFGTLQDIFMQESDLYYGQGIKSSRRHAHRSKEYISQVRQWAKSNGFDFDDAIRETDGFIDRHNNTPYSAYSRKFASIDKSPAQLHDESDKPNTYPVEEHQFCYMFGLRKEVSIRNYMIHTQIDNAPYYYGIDECEIAERYTGVKLTNCFDYEDYSKVHLYNGNEYVGTFKAITPAQRFGPGKDMRAVGKMQAIATKMDNYRNEKRTDIRLKKDTATDAIQQDEEPASVTSEVGMMLGGVIPKPDYEDAESRHLLHEWEEAETQETNIRNQY